MVFVMSPPYKNAALKSSCSAANDFSATSAVRVVEGSSSLSGEQEGTAVSLLRAKGDDDERPLIILDMEESLSAVAHEIPVDDDVDDMLVQNLLKEFVDHTVDEQSVSEDNDSELTDFERQVLSKYMKEMCEQEVTNKTDAVCHLTTTDHQQEQDSNQVIEFSPIPSTIELTENNSNEKIELDQDHLNNNSDDNTASSCSKESQIDENANRIRIDVSKLEAESLPAVPIANASAEPANSADPINDESNGQQPSFVTSPTPKVISDSSESTSTTIVAAAAIVNSGSSAQLANTHNTTSTIINCTAIPSTTSTTVAITNMSSTTSTYNQARGNQISQQKQQQQQQQPPSLEEQEELLQLQQRQQQERSRAMRRNFSVWVGVTSCVWGILIYLIKSYTSL